MKSLKSRLNLVMILFAVFAFSVVGELLFMNYLQSSQAETVSASGSILNRYSVISEKETQVYRKMMKAVKGRTLDLGQLSRDVREYKELSEKWISELEEWLSNNEQIKVDRGFITVLRKRQDAFEKGVAMLKEGKTSDVRLILDVEKQSAFNEPQALKSITDGLVASYRRNFQLYNWCLILSGLINVIIIILVFWGTSRVFGSILGDITAVSNRASSLRDGDFTQEEIKGGSTIETDALGKAFNEMQLEIKNRDQLLRENAEKIQGMNDVLEKQVEERNQQIRRQNELLIHKNEELEQILYAASHDMRTPLIGIQGFSQELEYLLGNLNDELANSDLPEDKIEKIQDLCKNDIPSALNFIVNGTSKMETLFQGLLRVSRLGLEEIKQDQVDMNLMMQEVTDQLSFQAQTANAMIITEKLDNCIGDKDKLEQVFTNLVSNAIKYRHSDRSCEIKITSEKGDDGIVYSVADNGIGVSEENLPSLFKTFYRVNEDKAEGEGLGLTIARRIIDRHGGRIWVESVEGQGSTFKVKLFENLESKNNASQEDSE